MICLNIWWYSETLCSSHEKECHINLEECLHTTVAQIEVITSSCLTTIILLDIVYYYIHIYDR